MPKSNGSTPPLKVKLDSGWVLMRPMTIDDLLAIADVESDFPAAIRAVKDGVVEAHFDNGKPLGEQPVPVYTELLKAWNRVEDEVALPPANAPPSA